MTDYKIFGGQAEIRIASGTAALGTATPVGFVSNIRFSDGRTTRHSPDGVGSYSQRAYAGLLAPNFTIERDYDKTEFEGDSFASFWGAGGTTNLTKKYIEVKQGTESGDKYWRIHGCIGTITTTTDEDGFTHETCDGKCDSVTENEI